MSGVIFSSDLVCSSTVTGAANRLGLTVTVAMSEASLLDQAAGAELVILDLNTPAADPVALAPRLRALVPAPAAIVAFGPHVHEDRLTAAPRPAATKC